MLVGLRSVAGATVELAEAEVAVGDEGAHAEFAAECQRLAVVAFSVLGAPGQRNVTDEAKRMGLAASSTKPAGERQRLSRVAGSLVDPPGTEAGHSCEQKNERRTHVILVAAERLDGARDQRQRLVMTAGEGVGGAEGCRDGRDIDDDLPRSAEVQTSLKDLSRA